jgi:uncharacterized membrane protein YsdA (DUF1294 family)/cold shock CspA family protein
MPGSGLKTGFMTMRRNGRISRWNDDRGFGFIAADDGGKDVFLHISAFRDRGRKPEQNEPVTYELGHDPQGRPKALAVAFVEKRPVSFGLNGAFLLLAGGVLAFVAGAAFVGRLASAVAALYFASSIVAFVAYAMDKSAAKEGRWRIPEKYLQLFSLFGGWPGALAAQRLLRHKSSKKSFQVEYWVHVALNCCFLAWCLTPSGSKLLHSLLG